MSPSTAILAPTASFMTAFTVARHPVAGVVGAALAGLALIAYSVLSRRRSPLKLGHERPCAYCGADLGDDRELCCADCSLAAFDTREG